MYGECARNFLNVQEFQAKRKKFTAQQFSVYTVLRGR